MRQEALFGWVTLALTLFAGSAAAEPISWSYQWEALGVPYKDPLYGKPVGPVGGIEMWSGQSGGFGVGTLAFDRSDPAVWHSTSGSKTLTATGLNFIGGGRDPWFNVGYPAPGDYTLTLRVRDDSGQAGSLIFRGTFSGVVESGINELRHEFVGSTTGTLNLGKHLYTVTVGPARLPDIVFTQDEWGEWWWAQTTPEQAGEIDAQVEVADAPNAPEPTTLSMAGLGLLGAAAARWRRRRAA